jgi:hypothetical protein
VERDHGPPAEGAASFHTTRLTIVMRAAQSQAQGGQSALAELCRLKEFVRLDAEDAEERYRLEPVEFLPPEKMFNARWAMTVLGEVLKQLRQEYATAGKTSTFEALKACLDPKSSIARPSYDEVANRLEVTTGAVKTLIHRLRKRYTALLREEVVRTVSGPAEIDEEIHALCEALIASKGRLGP